MFWTIMDLSTGRVWIVVLVAVGTGLVAAGSAIPWNWLLPALLVGAGTVWVLAKRDTDGRPEGIDASSTNENAALETLKRQYAVGEIDDAEFERRLETLLETDSVAHVEDQIGGEPGPSDDPVDADTTNAAQQAPESTGHTHSDRHGCRRRGMRRRSRH